MTDAIRPFRLAIEGDTIDDLHRRLDVTRWPERETVEGWSQGAPLANVRALCEYWRHGYDWRRCEQQLNALGQSVTEIDGLDIHFLHVRSPHPNALPMVITHGWPGSVVEFMKVIAPLTDPVPYGGDAVDAFDVVAPSLPGFGFSAKPTTTGWDAVPDCRRLDHPDDTPRLRPLGGPRRRLGRRGDHRDRRHPTTVVCGDPPQHADRAADHRGHG